MCRECYRASGVVPVARHEVRHVQRSLGKTVKRTPIRSMVSGVDVPASGRAVEIRAKRPIMN